MTRAFKQGFLDMMRKIAEGTYTEAATPPAGTAPAAQVAPAPAATQPDRNAGAGIGTVGDNSFVQPDGSGGWARGLPAANTYFGQLARNTGNTAAFSTGSKAGDPDPAVGGLKFINRDAGPTADNGHVITDSELAKMRNRQAIQYASSIYPMGSQEFYKTRDAFVRRGQQNQKAYKETGAVPAASQDEAAPVEGMTNEQLELYRRLGASMARNGGQQYGSMA